MEAKQPTKEEREKLKDLCAHCDTPLLKEGEQYERIKQEGRREVVEWVNQNSRTTGGCGNDYSMNAYDIPLGKEFPLDKWQAFLKKKGIEEV